MKNSIHIAKVVILLVGIAMISIGFNPRPGTWAATEIHAEPSPCKSQCDSHQKDRVEEHFVGDHADHDGHKGHGHARQHSAPDLGDHDGHGHGALDGICGEHNVAEAVCALCQGSHIGDLPPGQGMKVRLADPDVAAKAGISLSRPQQISATSGIDMPGRVEFDRKQLAYLSPLASGVIRQVNVRPGVVVKRGDILAEISMPEVASVKAEFRTALARQPQSEATYLREKDLLERGISSRQEFQQAEMEYRANQSAIERYRQQLLSFGLSDTDFDRLSQPGETGRSVSLRAPFAGVITNVQTAVGEAVNAGTKLFTVANLNSLWIELAIPESRIYQVDVGSAIQARFDGLPGMVFSGQIFQVGAMIDERTRTLTALAEVQNPGRRLKVGMFGNVRILASEQTQGLAIPADAVQHIDGQPYVFIQEEPDLFELRRVTTGSKQDGLIVIATGLSTTDQVVSGQGFALKSEVLKARLGASCADH